MGGGGQTSTTQSTQSPPQILPQAAPGYEQAQSFYQGVLQNPPIYQGQRVAPLSSQQQQAVDQSSGAFAPNQVNTATSNQLYNTLQGNYLLGPGTQAAVSSAAQPLFQQLEQQVLPGIRDRAQVSGQGVTGTRRQVAQDNALNQFGESLATGVVAPIYNQERANQLTAVQQSNTPTVGSLLQQQGLLGAGATTQQQQQSQLQAAQALFEEPLFRQSQAAQALFGATGLGGGTGLSSTQGSSTPSTMSKVGSSVGLIASLAGVAAMAAMT